MKPGAIAGIALWEYYNFGALQKFLLIQTAFIGDVVLATSLLETLKASLPDASVDFLVRKGNESLLANNPNLHEVLVWDKKGKKIKNLLKLLKVIRHRKYDQVINLQRYFSTGLLTAFSGAPARIGFDKNPLRLFFTKRIKHSFDRTISRHETERNSALIAHLTDRSALRPALYPSENDFAFVAPYRKARYITIAPSSVWFTKKYPADKWIDFIQKLPTDITIYLLGGKENFAEAVEMRSQVPNGSIEVLAGKLSFLQSAALMKFAMMNYTNDSAPLHFASAMNAPVTAVFCSTVPQFGYGPLSDNSNIVETSVALPCRPCGLHGYRQCPLQHFKCAFTIETNQLLATLPV